MPELPEVQTVVNYLKEHLINRTIIDVAIKKEKLIKNVSAKTFSQTIVNHQIVMIARKGKYILFHLSDNLTIVAHLRMEGKFFIDETDQLPRKHDYIIFALDDQRFLVFNDSRQFGTFHLVQTHQMHLLKEIQKLAQDPLETNFNFDVFSQTVLKSHRNIKTILLDQTLVSGIGNIYANEILFMTKINPLTKGKDLTIKQLEEIIEAAKKILIKAIKFNGTTIHSFKFGNNQSGDFVNFLQVHFKEKQFCPVCMTKIIRFKDHGRSIYCCPKCQNVEQTN